NLNKNIKRMVKNKSIFPHSDNYIYEGLRLAILNGCLLLLMGGVSLGLFCLVFKLRTLGFPLTLPLWLVIFGTGIPSFILWFNYGKKFGTFTVKRRFTKGLVVGILGNIPGTIMLFILMNSQGWIKTNKEIYSIMVIIILMYLVSMPLMVVLGTMDQK
ncbi:MAG TPA: hypothetical protein VFD57_08860, partial [Clostridia bacterium]|nr:hypothetical protein [Clostridia bacterium]